jgi:glycogen debranching enzyme
VYDGSSYWRGPAWPQLNYLAWSAAHRWGRLDVVRAIEGMTRRGVVASDFAEYWNPDTGHGLGAIPQTWATVVAAMDDVFAPPAV